MKGWIASLLLLYAAPCFAADCAGSGVPENAHEYFEYPIRTFKEVTDASRNEALTALSGRALVPLSRRAFMAYAGKPSRHPYRYLIKAVADTDRQTGGFTVYRHAEEVLVLYTRLGTLGDCEDSALVIEVDRPLSIGHYGAGAAR